MNINLGDYRITSDSNNIIVQQKRIVDPTKAPNFKEGDSTDLREVWKDIGYHGKLTNAIYSILNHKLQEEDLNSLQEVIAEIRGFKREIRALASKMS